MPTPLRVLLLEDSRTDAELMLDELRKADFEPISERVWTEEEFLRGVRGGPEVVLADFSLPQFDAIRALEQLAALGLDIPLIIVSGTISEERAVQCMKLGAADYVLKDRPERLGQAVRRALNEKQARDQKREAEEALRLLVSAIQQANDSILIASADPETVPRVIFANEGFTRLTGYAPSEIIGQPIDVLVGEQTDQSAIAAVKEAVERGEEHHLEIVAYRKDGQPIEVEDHITPIRDASGAVTHFVAIQRDVTERNRAARALRESEERFALAARAANDGIWDWDLRANRVYLSPRLKESLGFADEELDNTPEAWLGRLHPDDASIVQELVAAHLAGGAPHFEVEHRMVRKDGATLWVLTRGLVVRDEAGEPLRVVGSVSDVTARKLAEERLAHGALHDDLTGLPNRTLFLDRARQAQRRFERHPERPFAVLAVDLDRLKLVNQSFGHAAGDQVIFATAQRLARCLRSTETVARLGADEFVVLLPEIRDPLDAAAVAQRILRVLGQPVTVAGQRVFMSASIGVSVATGAAGAPADLLRQADAALHRAKALGGGRYELFDPAVLAETAERLRLEADLHLALPGEQFELHYQPIVSLRDGRVDRLEALIRWHHPVLGLIPPADFIPLAERNGLIVPIGEWVLAAACRQAAAWRRDGHGQLAVAVNVSARQVREGGLDAVIPQILRETGLDPSGLELEITESSVMENLGEASVLLEALRTLGVRISIDDFGTGYSSLGYLRRLPIGALKIDRSFVQDAPWSANDAAIVDAIIGLAHALRLRVVAEGVETETHRAFLRERGCDEIQGYLISRPVPAGEVPGLLARAARATLSPA